MAEKGKVYKCLNPVGNEVEKDLFPLAPRIDTLNGREVYISISGEPDITIALEKRLKGDFPDVNWKVKKHYGSWPVPLTDEEMKTCEGLIQGVAW